MRLVLWVVNASVQVAEEAQLQPARLEELYVRHTPAAVGLAYLLTGDRDAAEDLVQDAFVDWQGDSGICGIQRPSRRTCEGPS